MLLARWVACGKRWAGMQAEQGACAAGKFADKVQNIACPHQPSFLAPFPTDPAVVGARVCSGADGGCCGGAVPVCQPGSCHPAPHPALDFGFARGRARRSSRGCALSWRMGGSTRFPKGAGFAECVIGGADVWKSITSVSSVDARRSHPQCRPVRYGGSQAQPCAAAPATLAAGCAFRWACSGGPAGGRCQGNTALCCAITVCGRMAGWAGAKKAATCCSAQPPSCIASFSSCRGSSRHGHVLPTILPSCYCHLPGLQVVPGSH